MTRRNGRNCRIVLLLLIPVACGLECIPVPIEGDFAKLEYLSPRECYTRDFPGYIGIVNQGAGLVTLEVAQDVDWMSAITDEGAECEDQEGLSFGGYCYQKINASTRQLTSSEIDRVLAVFSAIEEVTVIPIPESCMPARCEYEIFGVNGKTYTYGPCDHDPPSVILSQSSRESLIELFESFRADFPSIE